jgi:hypothetical protein
VPVDEREHARICERLRSALERTGCFIESSDEKEFGLRLRAVDARIAASVARAEIRRRP